MTSELELLAKARPTLAIEPSELVPTDQRPALIAAILASTEIRQATPRTIQRRARLAWAAAGAVAIGAVATLVISTLLPADAPGGPDKASAAILDQLAATAAGGAALGPGTFDFSWSVLTAGRATSLEQIWTAASGEAWGYSDPGTTVEPTIAPFCIHKLPGSGDSDFDEPSPAFLATYPTNPSDLAAFLRAHVHGSQSKDEAMFVAIGDMLRTHLPSPTLRAAGFRVLAMTDGVRVTSNVRDAKDRRTTRVDFMRRGGPVESLYFDPATSRVTEESTTTNGRLASTTVIIETEIVRSVPTSVVACADSPGHRGLTSPPVR